MTGPVIIVAGESSGERYGASLVRAFRKLHPGARFFGIGGPRMAAEGVEVLVPSESLSVMGLFEVVAHIPRIRRIFSRIVREAAARRPAAAVLIDSPDFNLRLAKRLRRAGIPVLYYISPTVWAWRKGRLETVRRNVSRMMLIFPFEERLYEDAGVPAVFIGHPLVEQVRVEAGREAFLGKHGLDPAKRLVLLLPGSRSGELRRHLPVVAGAVAELRRSPGLQFALLLAEGLRREEFSALWPGPLDDLAVLDAEGYEAMAAADVVLSSCGTATLEAALLGTPVVAFYRISPWTYRVGRRFVRIDRYSIVNILAGKPVIPELIQDRFTPGNLAREALRILESPEARAAMREGFMRVRQSLGEGRASENAARELARLIAAGTGEA